MLFYPNPVIDSMEQRLKKDAALLGLVLEFEAKHEQGSVDYMDEKTILQLIEYYEESSMIYKAMEVVDIALDQYKFRSDFYIIKARLLFQDNKINECLEFLDIADKISPYEKEIAFLKIRALCLKKQHEKAQELINAVEEYTLEGDMVEFYIAYSYINESKKDYKMMYENLKQALQIEPTNSEALERFWIAVELARQYDDSVDFHKQIIDKDPYNHLAWFNLGLSYSCSWEYEKAIDALEYSFLIEPNFEEGYMECAEMCIQQNKIAKALDIYLDALEKFGTDSDLLVKIASCLIQLNKLGEAKIKLLKALRLDAYNEEVFYLLGECYAKGNSHYSAINAFLKAIELDPEREEFYLSMAKSYIQVEDYNKATLAFQKATETCPEESIYWKEYVSFIIKLGLYNEAIQILDEAEEYAFGADLLYCRAIAMFFLKQKRAGLDCLAEAMEEDFNMYYMIYELAPELEVDKDINAMIRYYEKEFGDL